MTHKYKIEIAKNFTSGEIAFFKSVVLNAGEVDGKTFDGVIARNPFLILYPSKDSIKAVGALKFPYESYKNKVFRKSKTDYKPEDFELELGWIVSLEAGNGRPMTKILAEYKSGIYATVRNENERMIQIITSVGFKKVGESYGSERGDYLIGLYVKEK